MASVSSDAPAPPLTPAVTKLLVVADVRGRFDELFAAVAKAHAGKAGPFACCLCVGRFFGASDKSLHDYTEGRKSVPLPIFFVTADEGKDRALPTDDLADGGDLGGGITFLGLSGRKTVCGLEVAYLSGTYDAAIYASGKAAALARGRYSEEAVEELLIEAHAYRRDKGVDVLLTSEWGEGVDNLVEPQLRGVVTAPHSPAVGRLGRELAPRYHFAGGQAAPLTLEPYRNHLHTSRFYGLAAGEGAVGSR